MSKRITTELAPNSQISSRNEIFEENEINQDDVKEEAQRMDEIMRRLMGGGDDDEQEEEEEEKTTEVIEETVEAMDQDNNEEEEFSFRLFSTQAVTNVTISDDQDTTTNDLSKLVAEQQVYEFDETDPEFQVRVKEAVMDYDTIIQQSKIPYPALICPNRVIHILSPEEQAKKEAAEKKVTKKRKSKKCRDFEKAVKEGKIKPAPKMRNPNTPDGWPGWPGNRTKVAIIDYQSTLKGKGGFSKTTRGGFGGRGGFSGRGGQAGRGGFSSRGSARGGRGRGQSKKF